MPRTRILIAILLSIIATATTAQRFVGTLELVPDGCEDSGLCTLAEPFGFEDRHGLGWEAAAGNITDGASIPPLLQPLVGDPFDQRFIRAAVLHDHYSKYAPKVNGTYPKGRPVRPWITTQRMFFEALIASDVSVPKATELYLGVLIGSSKWIRIRVVGSPCKLFPETTCLQSVIQESLEIEPERFDTPEFETLYHEALLEMRAEGVLGMEKVEDYVLKEQPSLLRYWDADGIIDLTTQDGAATE